ncbi:MAG: class II aldolase/adducin family protein [Nitrososphaerota archaeon]|nr:class II aldolase/adducin family protein [Nitrososphaerota archaeon]
MLFPELRTKIAKVFKLLNKTNLTFGFSGNISVRAPEEDLFIITPSGLKKDRLNPEDMVVININGNMIEGFRKPSVETPMHLAIYKNRSDVKAIVHAHPVYSAVFAVTGFDITPITEEMILYTGGEVKVAKYALFGTEELARNVLEALGNRKAVLLRNHGIVTCGKNLDEAIDILFCVEREAKIIILSKLLGEPKPLPKDTIDLEKSLYEEQLEN